MYDRIIFYNHFGAGDIYESREFVKAWMRLIPSREYFYSHGKNPRILLDIPELQFKAPTVHMDAKKGAWDDLNGNLYVNTWIGRSGKYVLPGIGCTVEKLYEMHNDMLGTYNLGQLPGQPIDYLPEIDYEMYNLEGCKRFLSDPSHQKLVFIDNGLVQSAQAKNFEFIDIIEAVANNHPHISFLVTHSFVTTCPNIYGTSAITGQADFDLNEVSYLSLFCKVLIGRNSGPHVFTQNRINCADERKKLLSFTYHPQGASFVVNTPVKIQKFWHDCNDSQKGIIEEIERIL